MAVGQANISIYQGDDYDATVAVLGTDGSPTDLTGYVVSAQIRLGPADTNSAVIVDIVTTVTPPNVILLSIPHTSTWQLSGRYVWDLQLKSSDNVISTILAGTVTVTPEVTREPGDEARRRGQHASLQGVIPRPRDVPPPPPNPLLAEYWALQAAIGQGVAEVRFQDRTVRYPSIKDMILAANYIYQQLVGMGLLQGTAAIRQVRMFTNKGL